MCTAGDQICVSAAERKQNVRWKDLLTSQWGSFINVPFLAVCSDVMINSCLHWLGTQTGSYRCCPASQWTATFNIALTEEQEICQIINRALESGGSRLSHWPQQRKPPPPHLYSKDVLKLFLFNLLWGINTLPFELILTCAENKSAEPCSTSSTNICAKNPVQGMGSQSSKHTKDLQLLKPLLPL